MRNSIVSFKPSAVLFFHVIPNEVRNLKKMYGDHFFLFSNKYRNASSAYGGVNPLSPFPPICYNSGDMRFTKTLIPTMKGKI